MKSINAIKLFAISAVAVFAVSFGAAWLQQDTPVAQSASPEAWGAEVMQVAKETAQSLSPVTLANACGLGASSCFRCHNGRRAESPVSDITTAPWHKQHEKVNYSCAGCHNGNPRILKQEIAHKGLIANPTLQPDKTCASCHASDSVNDLVKRYHDGHPHLTK